MLPTNEVLKGVWMVNWKIRKRQLSQHGFKLNFIKIADFYYVLKFSATEDVIELSVANFGPRISVRDRLSKVIAVHEGEKVDMKRSDPGGSWGPAQWKNIYHISNSAGSTTHDSGKSPSFQIIFELLPEPESRFSKLFDTKSMADIEFLVQGTKIEAHQLIVASASPVMAALFEPGKFKEGSSKTVEITDIDVDVFQQMLRYMYTGAAPKLDEYADALLVAAEKYQFDSLKNDCEEYLSCNVTTENVTQCLLLAHYHRAPKLLEASLKHLADHKEEVWSRLEWKALGKEHGDVFYLATERMCTNESRKRKLEP